MHELSIAQSVVDAVTERIAQYEGSHVISVRLRIGDANAIEFDSLTFSFEMLTMLVPVMNNAKLIIDRVPHRARCHHCTSDFTIAGFIAQCPLCKEWSSDIISGTEFELVEMEIEPLKEEV